MKHDIVIERINSPEQIEQCAKIYPAAYNAEPWNDSWTNNTANALLTSYYNTPGFEGWIARHNQTILGTIIGNVEPYYSGDIFILKEVFVAVNAQGTGIGGRLLSTMKEDLEKLNIKMIILSTRKPIFDFYTKSGFEEMEGVGTMIFSY